MTITKPTELEDVVATALCPEGPSCCRMPRECPEGWDHLPPAKNVLAALDEAGLAIVPEACWSNDETVADMWEEMVAKVRVDQAAGRLDK